MSKATLLAPPELAEYLNVSVQRLAEWRHQGIGPTYVKAGRMIRYRPSDVFDWLDQQTVETGGAA